MHLNHIILLIFIGIYPLTARSSHWQVQDLSISHNNEALQIDIGSMQFPFFQKSIKNIHYVCQSSTDFYPIHHCKNGTVTLYIDGNGYNFGVSGWINLSKKTWKIVLTDTNKNIFIKSDSREKDTLEVVIKDLDFLQIKQILPVEIELNGELTTKINTQIIIDFSQQLVLNAHYQFASVNYEQTQGDYVMAEAEVEGHLSIKESKNGFIVENTSTIDSGEALLKDIYLMFDDYPVIIKSIFKVENNLEVHDIKADISSNNDVFIKFSTPNLEFKNSDVDFRIKNLKTLYQGFLASYFEILGVDDLEVIGQAQGKIKIQNETISAIELNLSELYLAIESKKININDLDAKLQWQQDGERLLSQIWWDELLLAGMPIQKSNLELLTQGQQLWVLENTSLPIFDGSLMINKLALDKIFDPEISIDFKGEVKPISIALITEKMGWPIMNGTISGLIPGMKKIGHSITFDGVLDIDVFDGQMQVENLSIERLFGIAPVIAGDIVFSHLNLQQITSTYDFGEITGVINGYVKGLRITNWKADRLDAHLESVKTKGVKQTISQRAIDNISSIGGIQGALSRSFLRFFDYFKYKHIGFGCKLRNSICQMSGVNNKRDNYTLVEGKGIPSINIIGFRKFIDWEVFIDRLLNAGY